jgi:hypothetical protein
MKSAKEKQKMTPTKSQGLSVTVEGSERKTWGAVLSCHTKYNHRKKKKERKMERDKEREREREKEKCQWKQWMRSKNEITYLELGYL